MEASETGQQRISDKGAGHSPHWAETDHHSTAATSGLSLERRWKAPPETVEMKPHHQLLPGDLRGATPGRQELWRSAPGELAGLETHPVNTPASAPVWKQLQRPFQTI